MHCFYRLSNIDIHIHTLTLNTQVQCQKHTHTKRVRVSGKFIIFLFMFPKYNTCFILKKLFKSVIWKSKILRFGNRKPNKIKSDLGRFVSVGLFHLCFQQYTPASWVKWKQQMEKSIFFLESIYQSVIRYFKVYVRVRWTNDGTSIIIFVCYWRILNWLINKIQSDANTEPSYQFQAIKMISMRIDSVDSVTYAFNVDRSHKQPAIKFYTHIYS